MHKVLRGGSYYTFEKYCKVTSRYGVTPQRWDIDYGLRNIHFDLTVQNILMKLLSGFII